MANCDIYDDDDLILLKNCTLCPRECGVDRFKEGRGYCGMDAGLNIASICVHRGEEPSISGTEGICNIFFEGCNLSCIYCQNHEISQLRGPRHSDCTDLNPVLDKVEMILSSGIEAVGFVSPSHAVPQVKAIIKGLNSRGLRPVTIYNTNSYDKVETIRSLSGLIDVYLPDIKYITPSVAGRYSEAPDYPEVAMKALAEMYYQKGSVLRSGYGGRAECGMIIRHLVLPGCVEESIRVLESIAENLSPGVHLSLMSQYNPAYKAINDPVLNRPLLSEEYYEVVGAMQKLGFRNGWIQEMDSHKDYIPDFSREHPFG